MGILFLCILFNAIIGVIFKMFHRYNIDNVQAIVFNYITCIIVATAVQREIPIPSNLSEQPWLYYAAGLGLFFIIVFNTLAVTMQYFGIVIGTVFQKMSLIAPTLLAILVYDEPGSVFKWIGIATALIAIILLNYEKSDANAQTTQQRNATMWIFPIATFLGSCVIDSGFYYIEKNNFADNGDIGFIATLFLFTSIYGLIILFFRLVRQQSIFAWKNVVAGIALGIPNFFAIYLLILALQQGWGGSVVFPVNNVGILVLSAFFGILIFRERITGYRITGFLLALTSILLITH